jgi:catechol-2,3-dioxygenase
VKVGHVALETPDLDRLVSYYTEVLDFDLTERGPDAAYLATDLDHHCVSVANANGGSPVQLAFQVAGTLDDAAAELDAQGIAAERRSDPEPGIPELLRIHDPDGNALDLYAEIDHRAQRRASIRPQKLGHVCYFVSDANATSTFYQDVLGFRWSDSIGDVFHFLRCNADHHAINLLRSPKPRRIHHIAYEMRNLTHLQSALESLGRSEHKVVWGPGRHGPGHNVFTYHHDPDGTRVELFTELDLMLDERLGYFEPRPWHADAPQRPKVWEPNPQTGNSWGPTAPESFRE